MKVKDRERPSKRQKAKLIKKQAWNLEGKPYACRVTAGTHTQNPPPKNLFQERCALWYGMKMTPGMQFLANKGI